MATRTVERIERWLYRDCPHCGGDLQLAEDIKYIYLKPQYECLQCARRYTLNGSRDRRSQDTDIY